MILSINNRPWITVFKAFLLLQLGSIAAQNNTLQRFNSDSIQTVRIEGDQIFKIDISTHKVSQIEIESVIDGAYLDQYQVVSHQSDNTLVVGMESNPLKAIPDDKRNAHKVIAAELRIKLPEMHNIRVSSDIASVQLKGAFRTVAIELLQGFCKIIGSAKEVLVHTIDGNIYVETKRADITAMSANGEVSEDQFQVKESLWHLRSIHGNIEVLNQNQKY